jgi:probable HAF family extracellular repeat protein
VAILLSDGLDDGPNAVEGAADDANDYGITIMTIALSTSSNGAELLGKVAAKTGGIAWRTTDAGDLQGIYEAIYEDVVTIGVEDVTITDWVSYDPNRTVMDLSTITPTPVLADPTVDGNEYVISWELPSLENTERLALRYQVELYDLAPGEIRPVNNFLEVAGYDSRSGEQVTIKIGQQSVKVAGATGLSMTTDRDTYTPGQLAELTTFFEAPDALQHAIIGSAGHFADGEVNGVDVNSQPGSVVLWRNDDTRQYGESGTLNLIVDAGSGAYWGNIDFSGWYPGQYEVFDKINNYVRSNLVSDVHLYQRQSQGDPWWQDSNDTWYAEVDDNIVGNALITDEGWIAYVPLTGPLDNKLDSDDFTIEGWISTDANGVLFYRGDDSDGNYLSIYAYDDGVSEKLYVDCNIGGFDRDFKSVDLAFDGNDWHYVALTVADGNAALCIDGNEPNDMWTYEMNVMSELDGMPIVLGGDLHPTLMTGYRTYPCRVDEVRIYDRALEPNEIWENYTQGRDYHLPSEVRKGLVGYWDFGPGPQDQSDLSLGGMFIEALQDEPGSYDLRRVTGRSSEPDFPQESCVIAASKSIDIIDAEDNRLWMRFPTDRRFLWLQPDITPGCVYAHDGRLYVGQDSHPVGLSIIDFRKDEIRNILPDVPDGLTAHWKLDESSGTTASDSSGNGHNGDLLGGFSFDSNSVTGIMSGALDFNGVNDYVNCPTISFDANGQYTYSVWFSPNNIAVGNIPGVISDEDYSAGTGFVLYYEEPEVYLWSGAAIDKVAATYSNLSNDGSTWYHIAFTYDGNSGHGSGTLYLDGEYEDGYTDERFANNSGNFKIGVLEEWPDYFKGAIDDVRIYDRVLSADEIRRLYGRGNKSPNTEIRNRFLTGDSNSWSFVDELILRDGYINDVMAARIGDANYIAIGTNKGVAVIKDETDIYHSNTTAQVTNVFLTDTNDLYFVITEPEGDSLYAVYDIDSISDDFAPDAVYGYRDQNAPNLATNEIRGLYVVSGGGGNNIIYMGTPDGVVQIQEDQGQRASGTRKVYVSWRSDDPNNNDFVNVLAGDSNNVTAVYADANQLWAVTSDGSAGSSQVLSIIELSSDELADSVSQSWSSQPRLPAGVVTALDWGLVGTKAGAMAFEPDFISPIAIRARCIYSDDPENPGEAVSEWTDWITERPTRLMDVPLADPNSSRPLGRSRYLELEVKLTRWSDPYITPILEAISVGYTPTELAIDVSVEDSGGIEVYGFDRIYINDADMGREIDWVHYFETYSRAPTDYNAVARLVDIATQEPLTTAVDGFEIMGSGGPDDANLTGSITTNRRSYETGDVVKIEVVVFNESQNVSADNVEVKVYVQEPNKSPIGPYGPVSYIIDSLGSGANDPKRFYFTVGPHLMPAVGYEARLVLPDANRENPTDAAQFEIIGSCQSQNALTGTLHIDHPRITPTNSTMNMAITASTGNEDLTDVTLFVKVFDMSDPNAPNTIATFEFPAGDLTVEDPCTAITFPYTPEDLEPDTYPVKLIGRFRCGDSNDFTEVVLVTAVFAVVGEIDTSEYVIIDLGAIDDGSSYGHALNGFGHVTGYSTVSGNSHAFLWKCGTMIDLGVAGFDNSIGWGINDSEQIAGCFYDTAPGQDANAFIWQDGAYSDIGTGPNGVHPVEARGINVKGQVTGYYTLADGNRRAFVYPEPPDGNSQWDDLGNSGISAIAGFADSNSVARGIAGDGDLAGYWDGGGGISGFVRLKGVVKDAGQHDGNDMYLPAINSSGQAAGYSSYAGTDTAILYQDGTRIVLDPCSAESRANSINSAGEIVGTYYDGSDWKAFIWQGGLRHDLKEQLALTSSDPNWWKLTDANAMNDQGQIVGYGTIDGKTHAYRLDPLPFEVDDPNLILWLRADTGVVKNPSDANYVSTWIDQSFSGHDVAAPNVSSEPQFVVDTSCCNPRLSFDGVDDVLQSSLTHDGNSTVFMVVATGSLETGALFASENGSSDPNAFEIELDGTDLQLTTDSGSYQISPAATESVILEVVIDGNSVSFYKNGRNVKSSTVGDDEAKSYTDVVLGKGRSGGFPAFEVAEVIVFDDALADARRVQVADYLAAKHWLYGLADVKDPILWYRADGGVTVDTNDRVSRWADQSGGEHHAVQDEPSDRPELADGVLQCKSAILFDGEVIDPNMVVGPIDTYLVLDKSGSMQLLDGNARSRLHYAKDAARQYVDRMLGQVHTGQFSQGDDANGIVSMEAENYYKHTERDLTGWSYVMDKPGWSGGGAMLAPFSDVSHSNDCNAARLDYRVNFVKTGTHYIWVRCWKKDESSQICHADLDEQDIATAHRINAWYVPDEQWGWTNIITGSSRATFDVNEAGIHTVNMYVGQGGFRLDKIVLTTNASYTPNSPSDPNGPADTGELEPSSDQRHRVGLITFSHELNTAMPLTNDLHQLKQKICDLAYAGDTNYEDAIELMTAEFNDDANGSDAGRRRACVFLSDGKPNKPSPWDDVNSVNDIMAAVDAAVESDITFWTIGVGGTVEPSDPCYDPGAVQILEDMNEHGGGSCFMSSDASDLEGVFLEIYYEVVEIFSKQTLSVVFKTAADISRRQVLWALGDPNRGMNLYIDANELYFGAWSRQDSDGNGPETIWGPKYMNTEIEVNTPYLVDFVYDHNESTIEGYLNGGWFETASGVGKLFPEQSRVTIGNNPDEPTRFHDDTNDVNNFYTGHIAEVLYYHRALSDAERTDIDEYLAGKFGIEIARGGPPTAIGGADAATTDSDWDGRAYVSLVAETGGLDVNGWTFEWYEAGVQIAAGANTVAELGVGRHVIELRVKDDQDRISIDTVVVTIKDIPGTLASKSLIGHWKLDGDANDCSGNALDANVVNAAEPNCWRDGKVGGAIKLKADSNEYLDLSGDGNDLQYLPGGSSARTIMGWFEAGDNGKPTFFDYGTDDPNDAGSRLAICASSQRVAVTIGAHVIGIDNIYPALKGWHHVAVALDAGAWRSDQVKIYVDGVRQFIYTLDGSDGPVAVDTNTWSDNSHGYIGADCRGNYFDGRIDDVRVYSRALRSSELSVFAAGPMRYHVIDLGLLGPADDPRSSEAHAINNQGDVVGKTTTYLKPNTKYYWRVDEKNQCAETPGDTWEFTTGSE